MPRVPINWLTNLPLVLPEPQVITQAPWRSRFPVYGTKYEVSPTPLTLRPACRPGERCNVRDWDEYFWQAQLHGLGDYVDGNLGNMQDLSIDVSVKLPKSVVEAARIAPSLAKEFPKYAHKLQEESARVTGTVDAINIGLQTLGVSLIVGGIITVLLLREKPKNKE